ncbi:MAG TPA: redoxin domain-containing protein [Terriglobia bacterium]|nr:redoxin domain-containing protein [Terriglobia bacterium]
MKTLRTVAGLALLVASVPTFSHAFQMSAGDVLARVGATYKNLQSYQFEAEEDVAAAAGGASGSQQSRLGLAVEKPDKVRLEFKDEQKDVLVVSNGSTTWEYMPQKKQYTKEQAASATENEATDSGDENETDLVTATRRLLVTRYLGLARYTASARLGKNEKVKFDGQKVDCYVVELRLPESAYKLWIDKQRFLVLRLRETSELVQNGRQWHVETTVNLKRAETGALPGEQLFAFTPPGKATEVQTLDLPGERPNLVGKTAADFTLKNLQGEKVNLSDLRGKVVLLDFWATWCPPCREELPRIEKLYEAYGKKDVVILGVNNEDSRRVRKFLEKHGYNFTVLMDSQDTVHRMYACHAIPTVIVIDRGGVVKAQYIGGRSQEELVAALKTAGLQP